MLRKSLILFTLASTFLIAGLKVPTSELILKERLWFYGESETPYTGIAFSTSKKTGSIIHQTNYIDGLAWGKYYEWWEE